MKCVYQVALEDFQKAVYYKNPTNVASWRAQEFAPGNALASLRSSLILEEAEEASAELENGTRVALAKELADVLYVIFGTAVEYDIPLMEVFLRVHDNNMLKIKNSTFNQMGKLIKPKNHPKVNISDIVKDN